MYSSTRVVVSEEDNKRLKKMIDRRVLVIMILTYFLQALDKGTMSFASIMGIKTDAHLENGQKVGISILSAISLDAHPTAVLLAHHLYLHRRPDRRVPNQLDHPTCSHRQVSRHQHLPLGHDPRTALSLPQFHWLGDRPHPAGYLRGMLSAYFRPAIFHVVQA